MDSKEKNSWRDLFDALPEETLPQHFHEQVMQAIRVKAALKTKRSRYWEIFGFVSGIAAMLIACVFAFYYFEITFPLPDLERMVEFFPKPDWERLTSSFEWSSTKPEWGLFEFQSFGVSLRIGLMALLLLICDSIIRRHIERKKTIQ